MNKEQSNDDYILQLKQTIIFLKSEVAKYQNEVTQLKKNDYYSLSSKLEEENFQLKKQEKQLSLKLLKLQRDFEKEAKTLRKEILNHEEKKIKLINSIKCLVKEKDDLRTENTQLAKKLQMMQNGLTINSTNTSSYTSTSNFELTFFDFIQRTNQQFQALQEEFKMNQSKFNNHIIGKIECESNKIKELLHTMKEAKISTDSPNDKAITDDKLISDLDNQIYMIYSKTLSFEKQLEQKLQLLNNVEQQLIELTNDIEKK